MTTTTTRPTTQTISHAELRDNDLNWREGHLFRVANVRHLVACVECERVGGHGPNCKGGDANATRVIVRFAGHLVDRSNNLAGTGYDGGTYGAWGDYPATIERRDDATTRTTLAADRALARAWARDDRASHGITRKGSR